MRSDKARTTTRSRASGQRLIPAACRLAECVQVAKAMGHRSRLRILGMLGQGPLCVCQMTAVLGLSASTVSAHLAELRHAGLVVERKHGRWVWYRLASTSSVRRLARGMLCLAAEDPLLREDAKIIAALRAVPVDALCRAGLDLSAMGIARVGRKAG